jgi:cell wall-associated NlpC family hydrolase
MYKNTVILLIFLSFFIFDCAYRAPLNGNNRPARKENRQSNAKKTEPADYQETLPLSIADFKTEIQKFWKAPYVWGGASPNGTDCSGLIVAIYKNACGLSLPHSTQQLYQLGKPIPKNDLSFSDLVFFTDGKSLKPTHVGLYISRNIFLHASLSDGVTLGRLNKPPYDRLYVGARRMILKNEKIK